MSCHGVLKKKDSVIILKFINRICEYYFSNGINHSDFNKSNLEKLPSKIKEIIYSEVTDN